MTSSKSRASDTHYRKGANVKIAFTSEEARDLEEEVVWQTKLGIA